MSRKVILVLALSLVVVLATLIPVVVLESRRTPDWVSSLKRYLDDSGTHPAEIRSVWVSEAAHAERFPAEMLTPVPADWMWQSVDHIPPPGRVRCVRLEIRGGGWKSAMRAADQDLVLGYHDDGLYLAGWIVHTFRPGTSRNEREELFARMVCDSWERVSIGTR